MKWRKLIELANSSISPRPSSSAGQWGRRLARFEALENRKLFAADLAEITVVDQFNVEPLVGDIARDIAGEVAVEKELTERSSAEEVVPLKFDSTETFDWTSRDLNDSSSPQIMMMSFRGGDIDTPVADDAAEDVANDPLSDDAKDIAISQVVDPAEPGTVVMTMTGAGVGDDEVEALSDDDLIFYTMAPGTSGSEVETTSFEEALAAEDVNGDGSVTALDMLLVFNALNSYGAMPSSQLTELPESAASAGNWDVNRDGYVTPLDALLLANYFNNGGPAVNAASSQDAALVAPMVARVRNPVDDEMSEDVRDDLRSEPVDVLFDEELV